MRRVSGHLPDMGDYMKLLSHVLAGVFLLSTAASLSAGEIIIYGGTQKPGGLSWSNTSPLTVAGELKSDFGSTLGIRYSAGRVIGFEQSVGYSPRFARQGVKAFQMDSNLIVQTPGNVAPYGTVGMGFVSSWGQDLADSSDPEDLAAFAYSLGGNFALNYGGGLKIRRLFGPIGINIDVRGYRLPGARAEIDGQPVVDKSLRFVQTTAGLIISW